MPELEHLVHIIRQNALNYPYSTAMRYREHQQWLEISWQSLLQQTEQLSTALLTFGIQVQQCCGIFASNHPRWSLADLAILQIRSISTPIYTNCSQQQLQQIVEEAQIRLLFVGNLAQYEMACQIFAQCSSLTCIVSLFDDVTLDMYIPSLHWSEFITSGGSDQQGQLQERLEQQTLQDLITIIFTSGTTGKSKGVKISYRNIAAQINGHNHRLSLRMGDHSLCFLPLAHIFERAWSYYVLYKAGCNNYLDNPQHIKQAMLEVQPHVMAAVPRFFEKIYGQIFYQLENSSPTKQYIFHWALAIGQKISKNKQRGIKNKLIINIQAALAQRLVFKKLQAIFGGNIKFLPCGGAKLNPDIALFFQAIGINIKVGYGLTESTATVSCWQDQHFAADSVGSLMPNVEIKIASNNEILLRGPMITDGYWQQPKLNEQCFDTEGYFKTGDAGYLDQHNNLFITERIKDMLKTSVGEYISPQQIENIFSKDQLIEQIFVIAEGRPFVSALIVPNLETLYIWANQQGIPLLEDKNLITHDKVIHLFQKKLTMLQRPLAEHEKIKKFTLIAKAFSIEQQQMTPTLKLRRQPIEQHYANIIKKMYQ